MDLYLPALPKPRQARRQIVGMSGAGRLPAASETHARAPFQGKIIRSTPSASRVSAIRGDESMHVDLDLLVMSNKGTSDYRARSRERERQRRQERERAAAGQRTEAGREPAPTPTSGSARRTAASICGWCNGPITPRASGPIPKWCSATCRKRAWEQTRAAASGRSAVQIVERVVTPPPPPSNPRPPKHGEWQDVLLELSHQLDRGALYDRDLPVVAGALRDVLASFERRTRQG
jgi:hypothetical protein